MGFEIAAASARLQSEGALPISARDRALAAMQKNFASLYVVEVTSEVSALACKLPASPNPFQDTRSVTIATLKRSTSGADTGPDSESGL